MKWRSRWPSTMSRNASADSALSMTALGVAFALLALLLYRPRFRPKLAEP
jgi:hypothetical protein